MAKLALHFEGDSVPRVLDSELHPKEWVWSVGRASQNEIVFRHPMVSKEHGRIRFNEEDGCWQVLDQYSRNGTWIDHKRIPPGRWVELGPEMMLDFGVPIARVRTSFDIDETLGGYEADSPTGELSQAVKTEPMTGPWWAAIAADIWRWIRSPETLLGGIYRWAILVTTGAIASTLLWLWRQ
jgi:hypothetical protein